MLKPIGYSAIYVLIFLLQACGGGSSKGSGDDSYQTFTFNFKGQLANQCGVQNNFSDYEFYLQDDNWNTLKKYQPNSRGEVTFIITDESINYTVVAKTQEGSELPGYDVVSYYNIKTDKPATYHAKYDSRINNSSCQCNEQTLQLRHRPFTEVTSVLSSTNYSSWSSVDERTTEFSNVKVCRKSGNNWPVHSFAVLGTNSGDEVIGAAEFVNGFSATIDKVWQASAVEVADYELTLNNNHQVVTTSQWILNQPHFSFSIPTEQRVVNLFNSHIYTNEATFVSEASYQFSDVISQLGTFKVKNERRIVSEVAEQSLAVSANENKSEIDQKYLSELKSDSSYDFTNVSHYPMVIAEFDYGVTIDDLSIPVKWTLYGPNKGILPMNNPPAGYANIIGDQEDIFKTKITLLKSSSTNTYADFIAFAQSANPRELSNDIESIVLENK